MMNNSTNRSSNFLSGFIWGLLIGAAVVFLLGTKKGKKLLKVITDEGLELSEMFGTDEFEDLEEDTNYVPSPKKKAAKPTKPVKSEEVVEKPSEIIEEPQNSTNGSTLKKITSPARRFFRGISKRN